MNKYLLFFTTVVIMFIGFSYVDQAQPEHKNARVYKLIQPYTPYILEKRFGGAGFYITSKVTGVKEKPPAKELFKRLDYLEKLWGETHLKLDGDTLVILDDKKKEVKRIKLQSQEEIQWVKTFFNK